MSPVSGACPSGPSGPCTGRYSGSTASGSSCPKIRPQIRVIPSKDVRAVSRWVTTIARGIPTAAHSSQTARVAPATASASWAAETTKRAASAARRPALSSPTKSA